MSHFFQPALNQSTSPTMLLFKIAKTSCRCWLIAFSVICGTESPSLAVDKLSAPSSIRITEARKAVRLQFRAEFSRARKPEQRGELSQLLLDQSGSATDTDVGYAMLYEAAIAAAQAGQSVLSMSALQKIDEQFEVDLLPIKIEVLASFVSPESIEDAAALLDKYRALSSEAVAAEQYEIAVAALQAAADGLKKPVFRELRNVAIAERRQMGETLDAFEEARPAFDTLAKNPNDPVANLTWGQFVCFYKEDVEAGLELFSKANDSVWKPIAQAEMNSAKTPDDWINLGDAWFQAGNRRKDPIRGIALNRADRSWQSAFDAAPASSKREVAASINDRFVKLFGTSFVVTNGSDVGASLPRTERMIPGQQFTIEFWVSTRSAVGTLLSKCHRQGEASIVAHIDNGAAALGVKRGNGEGGSASNILINDGLWHHIAVVRTEGQLSLYVDGQRGAQITDHEEIPSFSPWKLGCSYGRPGCAAGFGGVRISDTARYESDFVPKKVYLADSNTLFAP